jgi:homoserine kinase
MTRIEMLMAAMEGEAVASGSRHADNISPSLFGGLVLTVGIDQPRVKQIPVPEHVHAVIVHPHLQVSTREARAILSRTVNLSDFVWQTANLAGFISGCYTGDLDLIKASLEDVVIEKQRQVLIPGFPQVRAAALNCGALGCSISGAGPTVFALCLETDAPAVRAAMVNEFAARDIKADHWIVPVQSGGAHVVSCECSFQARAGRLPPQVSVRRCCRDWHRMVGCMCHRSGRNPPQAQWPAHRCRPRVCS